MKPAINADYYVILGVARDATQEEIRQMFLKERRELPCDLEEARRKRAILNEAYYILGNQVRRCAYDRSLSGYRRQGLRLADKPTAPEPFISAYKDYNNPFRAAQVKIFKSSKRVKPQEDKGPAVITLILLLIFGIGTLWPLGNGPASDTGTPGISTEAKLLESGARPLELPSSGDTRYYNNEEPVAKLFIYSAEGTNYFIKLVDKITGEIAMTIFVRGGESVEAQVPLGTYELRYASGESWYGEKHLFGENTACMKATRTLGFDREGDEVKHHRISLIKHLDRNLNLQQIAMEQF